MNEDNNTLNSYRLPTSRFSNQFLESIRTMPLRRVNTTLSVKTLPQPTSSHEVEKKKEAGCIYAGFHLYIRLTNGWVFLLPCEKSMYACRVRAIRRTSPYPCV